MEGRKQKKQDLGKNYVFSVSKNASQNKEKVPKHIAKPSLPYQANANYPPLEKPRQEVGKIPMPIGYQPLSHELARKNRGPIMKIEEPSPLTFIQKNRGPTVKMEEPPALKFIHENGETQTAINIARYTHTISFDQAQKSSKIKSGLLPVQPMPHHFSVPETYLKHLKQKFPINPVHKKEVEQISKMFSHLSQDYYIYDKIGEGTFSSVYKGVDIKFDLYDNSSWDLFDDADDEEEEFNFKKVPQPPPNLVWDLPNSNDHPVYVNPNSLTRSKGSAKYKLVAIKKIYVTSSCSRIENEIELLSILSGHPNVVSLITALRHEDQIIAITPYYRHHDFRDTFLLFSFQDMQSYLRCLLRGLLRCHQLKIIHRDVKPSNFLYHMTKRRGQLADFGLAQRIENTNREERLDFDKLREEAPKSNDPNLQKNPNGAYGSFMNDKGIPGVVKNDHRPSIRANRAGTRGFRAPEVLFKVVNQTSAIDIWSAGVILLCMLTRKFPFFNSPTDHDALIEIGIIYGKKRMQEVAKIFNRTFDTNVPSVTEDGMTFEELIHFNNPGEYNIIPYQAIDLLKRLLMLNPAERISAEYALQHPFLSE